MMEDQESLQESAQSAALGWARARQLNAEVERAWAHAEELEHESRRGWARADELEAEVERAWTRARELEDEARRAWARSDELDADARHAWEHVRTRDAEIERLSERLAAFEQASTERPDAGIRQPAGEHLTAEQTRQLLEPASYVADGLAVWHKVPTFLDDPRFQAAYREGMAMWDRVRPSAGTVDVRLEWRVHTLCWAAWHARQLEGSFVECSVTGGLYALAVCEYVDFNSLDKDLYLFDTFSGIPESEMLAEEAEERRALNEIYFAESFAVARERFAAYPRVRLVRGIVPESLATVSVDRVSFLSITMGIVKAELAAITHFWDKLVSGAVVVLDNYGWIAHRLQKQALDAFAERVGVEVLLLPTGQGLIIKP
jgi:hypothetical protein